MKQTTSKFVVAGLDAPVTIEVIGSLSEQDRRVLSDAALAFIATLHQRFENRRKQLLQAREDRQIRLNGGELPDFLSETANIRAADWKVASTPADLLQRKVEITGPVDAKMIINALNSGADVFMADFEDASSPTWRNMLQGQSNLSAAVRRTLTFSSGGKQYKLNDKTATLLVRPRGWHLQEKHVLIEGEPVSGSLFDFGLYFFHNAHELIERGSGPYFYLPKLEGHREARLWNDVFNFAQDQIGVPRGTIRATVLIETILAAFEMDEILYELKDHASGLNAGRWDYIFSIIKKLGHNPKFTLPDRAQVTMAVPFMNNYTLLLIKTCHRRGAHAIGGMSAFIPSKEPEVNARAFAEVKADKEREAGNGHDGTWVAHPGLVSIAREVFDRVLGDKPDQRDKLREDVNVTAADLLDLTVEGGKITAQGLRTNIDVFLQYVAAWFDGRGAVPLYNKMEDAATAEISRAQIWQWIRHGVALDDGTVVTLQHFDAVLADVRAQLGAHVNDERLSNAARVLDILTLPGVCPDFLTLPAYEILESNASAE